MLKVKKSFGVMDRATARRKELEKMREKMRSIFTLEIDAIRAEIIKGLTHSTGNNDNG